MPISPTTSNTRQPSDVQPGVPPRRSRGAFGGGGRGRIGRQDLDVDAAVAGAAGGIVAPVEVDVGCDRAAVAQRDHGDASGIHALVDQIGAHRPRAAARGGQVGRVAPLRIAAAAQHPAGVGRQPRRGEQSVQHRARRLVQRRPARERHRRRRGGGRCRRWRGGRRALRDHPGLHDRPRRRGIVETARIPRLRRGGRRRGPVAAGEQQRGHEERSRSDHGRAS